MNARILIIEDDPDICEILEYNLQQEGYDIDIFYDGQKGLDTIKKNPPDLVLLDLMLPGRNGLEIARIIRKDDHTFNVPIIMIGQEIATLVSKNRVAGIHKVQWDASNLPSGLYIYRLETGSTVLNKKMMLLK